MEQMDDSLKQLRQKAEGVCAREEYCDYDIEQKLIKWGATEEQMWQIMEYLHEYNYVNNERYVELYCIGKHHQLKWGRKKIAYQLKMKRIEDRIIEKGLQAIDEEEYGENLLDIAHKKWRTISEENLFKKEAKLINFLQSRGYEMEEIRKIIKQL